MGSRTVTVTMTAYAEAFKQALHDLEFAALDYADRRRVTAADRRDLAMKIADDFDLSMRQASALCGLSSKDIVEFETLVRQDQADG